MMGCLDTYSECILQLAMEHRLILTSERCLQLIDAHRAISVLHGASQQHALVIVHVRQLSGGNNASAWVTGTAPKPGSIMVAGVSIIYC